MKYIWQFCIDVSPVVVSIERKKNISVFGSKPIPVTGHEGL
jgi:hypothetical protein